MNSYFYNGILRWDFGLDNPNKAAAILAFALVLLFAAMIRSKRRWIGWSCAAAAVALGYGFVHTFSRGGFVALVAGVAIVAGGEARRLRERSKWMPALAAAALVAVAALWLGFAARIAASAPGSDGSVANRLEMWKAVPGMMADAPGGWGVGNSGDAFMGWYQPLSRHERYRTLVCSHFTWLVEFGWAGRIALASGWLLALGLCAYRFRKRGDSVPLAVWAAFWTAALFSSVAEEPFVWAIPAATLLPAFKTFLAGAAETRTALVAIPAASLAGGILIVVAFATCGTLMPAASMPLHRTYDGARIILGGGEPTDWIVFDGKTMGGNTYGRALRKFAKSSAGAGRNFGVAAELRNVPPTARRLALCGRSADGGPASLAAFTELSEVRVLSPSKPLDWLVARAKAKPSIRVFCGDLSPNCPEDDQPGLTAVPGAGDYLPSWPELAFSPMTTGTPPNLLLNAVP